MKRLLPAIHLSLFAILGPRYFRGTVVQDEMNRDSWKEAPVAANVPSPDQSPAAGAPTIALRLMLKPLTAGRSGARAFELHRLGLGNYPSKQTHGK